MTRSRRPSLQTRKVLSLLLDAQVPGAYGYEIIKKTGIKSGTLYPILMRLAEQGLLESEWQQPSAPGRPPRQIYRLTASGIEHAKHSLMDGQFSADPSTGPAPA